MNKKQSFSIVSIFGSSGLGKTCVATKVASGLLRCIPKQFFIQGSALELVRYGFAQAEHNISQTDFFSTCDGWIVVVDDVTPQSSKSIIDFIHGSICCELNGIGGGRSKPRAIILTSQSPISDPRVSCELCLEPLKTEASVELLSKIEIRGGKKINTRLLPKSLNTTELCEEVRYFIEEYIGNHPLGLVLYGRLLCGMDYDGALAFIRGISLSNPRHNLAELPMDQRHVRGISGSTKVHLDRMLKDDSINEGLARRARALFCAMSVLPSNVSSSLFTDHENFFVGEDSKLPFSSSNPNLSQFNPEVSQFNPKL